jgi:hypothetical protein
VTNRNARVVAGLMGISVLVIACLPETKYPVISHAPGTRRDSIQVAGIHLYELSQHIDRVSRPAGELPTTLTQLPDEFSPAGTDIWGHPVRYSPRGKIYELRSAGPDGAYLTPDDIIVSGEFGRDRPCETRDEYGVIRHIAVPPCSTDSL